jgi:hypothetical protein
MHKYVPYVGFPGHATGNTLELTVRPNAIGNVCDADQMRAQLEEFRRALTDELRVAVRGLFSDPEIYVRMDASSYSFVHVADWTGSQMRVRLQFPGPIAYELLRPYLNMILDLKRVIVIDGYFANEDWDARPSSVDVR